jgi:hypothetical protein
MEQKSATAPDARLAKKMETADAQEAEENNIAHRQPAHAVAQINTLPAGKENQAQKHKSAREAHEFPKEPRAAGNG